MVKINIDPIQWEAFFQDHGCGVSIPEFDLTIRNIFQVSAQEVSCTCITS